MPPLFAVIARQFNSCFALLCVALNPEEAGGARRPGHALRDDGIRATDRQAEIGPHRPVTQPVAQTLRDIGTLRAGKEAAPIARPSRLRQ